MKARVNTYLNIRTGTPEILIENNPNGLFLKPGDVIEIAATVKGEEYKNNNIWYKLIDGAFVWSGGTNKPYEEVSGIAVRSFASTTSLSKFESTKMSWAHDSVVNGGLGIVDLWNEMGVRGKGIGIVILDTGITDNKNDFIRDSISNIKGADFIKNTGLEDVIDFDGHGTNSAAIAAATGSSQLFGVAPDANIYVIRFTGNRYPKIDRLKKALELLKAQEWNFHIISISFCYSEDDVETRNLFDSLDKRYVIISALNHPDNSEAFSINNKQYPAAYENVIAVSAADKNMKNVMPPCQFIENKSCWAFPGESIMTLDESGHLFPGADQTSIATPFGGGVFALYLSYMVKNNISITVENIDFLKKILIESSIEIPVSHTNGIKKINFCRPYEALTKFNKHFNLVL